jgi:single-strand DNA-binding protein
VGHVYTSEYEDRDGNRRSSVEMRATAVGPDLARTIVRIEKPSYTGPNAVEGSAAPTAATDIAGDADQSGVETADPDPAEVVVAGPGALPLSA